MLSFGLGSLEEVVGSLSLLFASFCVSVAVLLPQVFFFFFNNRQFVYRNQQPCFFHVNIITRVSAKTQRLLFDIYQTARYGLFGPEATSSAVSMALSIILMSDSNDQCVDS